jgi:hypothetical protein
VQGHLEKDAPSTIAINPVTVSWYGTSLSQMLFNSGILASLKNSTVAEAVKHAEERATYPLEIEVSSHTYAGMKGEGGDPLSC